jgi:hypothetical protein
MNDTGPNNFAVYNTCKPKEMNILCSKSKDIIKVHIMRDYFNRHILCYLHFSNNHNATDNENLHYDILWKLTAVSAMLNDANSKHQPHSEHDSG